MHIDGDSYEIEPSPAAYNLRAMGTKTSTPHILRKVAPTPKPDDNLRGLYGAHYKYITGEHFYHKNVLYITTLLTVFISRGESEKRSKCFFTYIHLDLFRSPPSICKSLFCVKVTVIQ